MLGGDLVKHPGWITRVRLVRCRAASALASASSRSLISTVVFIEHDDKDLCIKEARGDGPRHSAT